MSWLDQYEDRILYIRPVSPLSIRKWHLVSYDKPWATISLMIPNVQTVTMYDILRFLRIHYVLCFASSDQKYTLR